MRNVQEIGQAVGHVGHLVGIDRRRKQLVARGFELEQDVQVVLVLCAGLAEIEGGHHEQLGQAVALVVDKILQLHVR